MPRKCCVPGCRTNYPGEEYTTIFFFPNNQELKQKWLDAIDRKNFLPSQNSVVCIKHFEPDVIMKEMSVKRVDGTILTVPRVKPKLTCEAVPSLFLNLNSYCSKQVPRKTKSPTEKKQELMKRDNQNCTDSMNAVVDTVTAFKSLTQVSVCKTIKKTMANVAAQSKNPSVKEDDDSDDVVIMEEEDVKKSNRLDTLASINEAIQMGKNVAQQSEDELTLLNEELEAMKADLSENVFETVKSMLANPACMLHIPMDEKSLEKMFIDILESLPAEELSDLTEEEFNEMKSKLDLIEKSNQAVSKIFLDCHSKIKKFKQDLTQELAAVEAEIAQYEKDKDPTCFLIDSDEDNDDITIVNSSFPSKDSKKSKQKASSSVEKAKKSSTSSQQQQEKSPVTNKLAVSHPKIQSILDNASTNTSMPPIEELRSQFADAVSKSMPTLITSLQQQQQQFSQPIVAQSTLTDKGTSTQMQSEMIRAVAAQPIKWPELKVHDKVLGKKFNDVWYGGTILDIYPPSSQGNNEWCCKVKFDGKGLKVLPGKHVAYRESIAYFIRVGTRVVASYREEDKPSSFYAGVIAEAPSAKNNRRFLVFFDDGYAQYCDAKELHKVYMQSENVWEDINPDTSAFIKEYLRIYPERPMVRLSKGQVVRTEWNGKWWTAKVQETDASLVKMYFQADKRTEWIYRGSTRLEPLFKALANADAIKAAGSAKGRRHNLNMRPSDTHSRPSVEYTRGAVDEDSNSSAAVSQKEKNTGKTMQTRLSESSKKKSNVAKKSTGGATSENAESSKNGRWEAPWLKYQRKAQQGTQRSLSTESNSQESDKSSKKEKKQTNNANPGRSSKDIASVLQERLATTTQVEYDEEHATGERIEKVLEIKGKPRIPFKPHKCSPQCVDEKGDLDRFRDQSSFQIPILMGWERQVCKIRPTAKRFIIYRAPCGIRLRNIEEVDKYLYITDSQLSIDLFCFDQQLHVNTEFVAVRTFCDIKDLSYGRENYKVSCVNGVDRHYPDYVEYSNQRLPSKGVNLNLNSDFLICCDCTDNCRDRTKCACQQQTIENTSWIGDSDPNAGYHYRRLPEPLFTGIVECNSRCKCDKRCANRVAQLGLRMRLQVFKTEKKGWGLRCLDDIAQGSFICIYAGQLLTDKGANEDGKQYGDEYLAELDFIEVVERQKEGYESDVDDIEFSDDENDANYKAEDDSDYTNDESPPSSRRKMRKRKAENVEADNKKDKKESSKPESLVLETTEDQPISISDDDDDEDEEDPNPKKEEKEKNPENTNSSPDVTKKLRSRAKKSTGGSKFNISTSLKTSQEVSSDKEEESKRVPTRSYFHDDTECYIMDAKLTGNLGRYLNHSCSPNVFVQNIFVDTHDLRFPWVAFFAGQYIRAGTELTWDYNYEVGSVPDKVLYCYCGSATCRGRLL